MKSTWTSWATRRVALGLAVGVGATVLLAGCAVSPPGGKFVPIRPFDAQRYMGTWYEMARIDHGFQKGLVNARADYTLQSDGTVKVVNQGYHPEKQEQKRIEGVAKFVGEPTVAALKVSFFGPFYGGYNVVALDEGYQTALVVGESADYFWLLTRNPDMPEAEVNQWLQKAQALGVDLGKVIRTRKR